MKDICHQGDMGTYGTDAEGKNLLSRLELIDSVKVSRQQLSSGVARLRFAPARLNS